ncbi:MAG: DUF5131 family protein [Desulfobacteraceae bacterium]|nr:DUF5131 family protein [Desulfobacteraceae bacterium]
MGIKSSIDRTELTWNPVTGCTKISEGCAHCYAERMARRLKAMGQKNIFKSFWNQPFYVPFYVPRHPLGSRTPYYT